MNKGKVVYTSKELIEVVKKSRKGDIIIFDEAQNFYTREGKSKSNLLMCKQLQDLRKTRTKVNNKK